MQAIGRLHRRWLYYVAAVACLAVSFPSRVLSQPPIMNTAQVFLVDDPSDAPADTVPVFFPRTLRAAIQCANYTPALDEIRFSVLVIQPTFFAGLPLISAPTIVNGSVGTTKLILDGSLVPTPGPGFSVNGLGIIPGNCTIRDIEIRNFPSGGILVRGDNNILRRCIIHGNKRPGMGGGVLLNNASNNAIVDNTIYGADGIVLLQNSNNNRIDSNLIGTPDGVIRSANVDGIHLETRNNIIRYNVISGNDAVGIRLQRGGTDTSKFNLIEFNKIGTNAAGNAALANFSDGIQALASVFDTIRNNVISGNDGVGIGLSQPARDMLIVDNMIGTNSFGTAAIANGAGINSSGFRITILNNTISGNISIGIALQVAGTAKIKGNMIGTDVTGMLDVGNRRNGIEMNGGSHIIGGPTLQDRNIISGNDSAGIAIFGSTTSRDTIEGNYIGVKTDRQSALPNGTDGVVLAQQATNNVVKGNIISGNMRNGILVTPRFTQVPRDNIIRSNWIGTTSVGPFLIPNNKNGIEIRNGKTTVIGGSSFSEWNTISNNLANGILIAGDTASGNRILGNRIGTDITGFHRLGNRGHGILILDADSNQIGSLTPGDSNLIVANDSAGIAIIGSLSLRNQLFRNAIGTVALPNGSGILIRDGQKNTVGGTSAGFLNQIVGNRGDGIAIYGDSNIVQRNFISTNGKTPTPPNRRGHGIYISGSGNKINGGVPTLDNIITDNGSAGIFIASGSGNTIRGNSIFDNDSLGIDLFPSGVAKNDSLDPDVGANGLQNYPVVDSATIQGTNTLVHGRLKSKPNQTYTIEFYANDKCDSMGYGEGKDRLLVTQITTNNAGTGSYFVSLPVVLDTNKVLSITATDSLGNTSEFSRCYPKFLKIVDGRDSVMREKSFVLYKVRNNPPTMTETLIDTFTTSSRGYILISNENIEEGDSLKVYRFLHAEPSKKRPALIPVTSYTVQLDNAKFDTITFAMKYDKIDSSIVQKISLDHTTIACNAFVSVEWDAETRYHDSLRQAYRHMSNYLYDISNGQMRLDTVFIADNRIQWNSGADFKIHANNSQWPMTYVDGLYNDNSLFLSLPRRFFGDSASNRNHSALESPLNPADITHYRTNTHEFGHYIGFFDEYHDSNGVDIPPVFPRCAGVNTYGFMDYQYANFEPAASEMSSRRQYNLCRNTEQWGRRHKSCWDYFESLYEKIYDGIQATIIKTDERIAGSYFLGPNEYGRPLNFDVGKLIVFPGNIFPPVGVTKLATVFIPPGIPVGNIEVIQYQQATRLDIMQGRTADWGMIYVLGFNPADTLRAAGGFRVLLDKQPTVDRFSWASGIATGASGDTARINLTPVQGEFPLVCEASLRANDIQLRLARINMFPSLPTVQMQTDTGGRFSYTFASIDSSYDVSVTGYPASSGGFTVRAADDSSRRFFFDMNYSLRTIDSTRLSIASSGGDAKFSFNAQMRGINRALVTSTQYPVIPTGLPVGIRQVSRTHALSVYPALPFIGSNPVAIRFENPNPRVISPRVYHWNSSTRRWVEVAGSVADTILNIVSVNIPEAGVYAAFAFDPSNDVKDEGSLVPEKFELFQNYPNPFNSTTTIRYSLPQASRVELKVYNILGQQVAMLVDEMQEPGKKVVRWDAKNIASGVYLYRLRAGTLHDTRKLILVK